MFLRDSAPLLQASLAHVTTMSINLCFSATTAFALIVHVGGNRASGLTAENQHSESSEPERDVYASLQSDIDLQRSEVVLLESIVWNATSGDAIEMAANSTTIRTADDKSVDGDYQRRCIVGSILTVFAAFTIFGNTLVMAAVVREPCLRATVTNYFVVSLAVADLVIGAVVMPFSIVVEVTDGWWPFGADWCDVWHSFDVLASTASILNLSVIALDRYWAITDPIAYPSRMSTARAFVFIGLVWVCSSAISFPAIAWWRHTAAVSVDAATTASPTLSVTQSTDFEVIDELDLIDDQMTTTSAEVIVLVAARETCHFTDDSWYLIFSSLISFYGPVSIILYAYYRIYSAAAAQLRSLERGSKVLTTSDGVSVSNGESGVMTLRIHRGGGSGYHTAASTAGARTNSSMSRNSSIGVGEPTVGGCGSFTSPRRSPDRRPISADASLLHSSVAGTSNATLTNGFRRFSSRLPNNSSSSSTLRRRWNTLTVCRRRLGRVARERKAAKTLGIVMGVFCACWVPFFVTNLLYGVCRHVGCVRNAETLFSVFTWLGYVNSGMNPVIYACSMRDFRRAFIRLLCRKRCRRPSPSSSLVTAGYGSGRAVALYRRSTGSVTVGHQLQRRSMQTGTGRTATDSEYSSNSFIYAEFPP